MGDGLHDKCGCGRIKKSYVAKCHYCRLTEVHEVRMFPKQGTTGLSTRESKKNRVYADNEYNRNLGRVGLPYGAKGTANRSQKDQSKAPGYGQKKCTNCGKNFSTYPASKAAQKAVGHTLAWGGLGLAMLTGGLTAFLFGAGPAVAGGSIIGNAEKMHTLCPKCRD